MPNLVIVAIPAEDDPVWRISSEKVPHMTILFLGPNGDHPEKVKMGEFLAHAASLTLTRFGLDVDRRGELGEDKADVVFFDDSYGELDKLREFRSQLLKFHPIKKAYDSVEQFPEWHPHLTLGYPGAPAKKPPNYMSDKIYYVQFDRIALWDGDYTGPEVILKRYSYPLEVAMSETTDAGAEFLAHFGVKGMRWGQRKDRNVPSDRELKRDAAETARRAARPSVGVRTHDTIGKSSKTPTKIVAKGGEDHPASKDAIKIAAHRQKMNRSGTNALSNAELKEVAERLNLENQVKKLAPPKQSLGRQFVKAVLGDPGAAIKTGQGLFEEAQKLKAAKG